MKATQCLQPLEDLAVLDTHADLYHCLFCCSKHAKYSQYSCMPSQL